MRPAVAPPGSRRKWLIDIGQPAQLQAQLASPQALAAPAALPLTQVERPVASLASVGAVLSEQPNRPAAARAHEDPPRHSKAGSDPFDPEYLYPAVVIDDLSAVIRKSD